MKSSKMDDLKVKQALKAAYDAKENNGPEVGKQFEAQVMRRVRALGQIYSSPDYFSLCEQYFWRLVPVTAALIIVLVAWTIQFDFTSEFDLATIFINNPISFDLVQQLLI
jgi:hypothetical protein